MLGNWKLCKKIWKKLFFYYLTANAPIATVLWVRSQHPSAQWIWEAPNEAVLNTVRKIKKKFTMPPLPMMVSTSMEMKRSLPSTSLCSGASSVSSLRSGGGSGHWFSLLAAVASKQPEERREFMMEPTCCCCCCWLNTVPCDPQRMSIIHRRQSKNFCVFKAGTYTILRVPSNRVTPSHFHDKT